VSRGGGLRLIQSELDFLGLGTEKSTDQDQEGADADPGTRGGLAAVTTELAVAFKATAADVPCSTGCAGQVDSAVRPSKRAALTSRIR
jgi:hypothetical protein